MKKIIVDTNVWYDGLCPSLAGYDVYITHNNIDELLCNLYLISNFEKVRQALKTAYDCTKSFLVFNPIDYLYSLENPNFNIDINPQALEISPYSEHYQSLIKYSEAIINGDSFEQTFQNLRAEIDDKRKGLEHTIELFMNDIKPLQDVQKHLFEKGELPSTLPSDILFQAALNEIAAKKITKCTKKDFWEADYSSVTNSIFVTLFSVIDKEERCISGSIFSKIPLLLNVFEGFFKKIAFADWKMTANDWFDIFSLAYVQPNDKYFTRDKKKCLTLIKGYDKNYLYEG